MAWPTFDKTINLGHVLTIVSVLLAGFGAYNGLIVRVSAAELRLQTLEQQTQALTLALKEIGALQRDVAVIRDRLERSNAR